MYVLLCIALALYALYKYGTRNFDYWSSRGVPHDPPVPFLGTDAPRYLQRRSVTQMAADVYFKYPEERFVGYYRGNVPELVVRDPELVKRIIVTDFAHFYPRGLSPDHGVVEPLLRNLFFADGDLWRLLRQRITPAFSGARLRAAFPLIAARAARLQGALHARLHALGRGRVLDARDVMARYTIDFIGSVGFGLDPDSLNDEESEFRKLGSKIFDNSPSRALTAVLKSVLPDVFKRMKYLGQELEDDVLGLVRRILERRGHAPCGRNDFIDMLLELQARGDVTVRSLEREGEQVRLRLDDTLLAAQAFIFFAAGFETSSSATSFTLHQLAHHPDVQRRVVADVERALAAHGRELSYDAVRDMTYLGWALQEGMRMFPSSGYLMRRCARRYTLPGTKVTLERGVRVTVPLQALHNDPRYFDNPDEFRPERFSPEEVAKRHKFVYLPFGEGPRACVGEYFIIEHTFIMFVSTIGILVELRSKVHWRRESQTWMSRKT